MSSRAHLNKRVGSWMLGRTIGEGTYSKVKYAQHAETGAAAAVKVLDKEHLVRSGMAEQVRAEVSILRQLHHPHIVELKEVMATHDKLYLVMELVTGGDLFDVVVAEGPVPEPQAAAIFAQLLSALDYCHRHNVYHRDLKPENVLLAADGSVRLSDFGLGALREGATRDSLLETACGTPNYVAPEVLARAGYAGAPADVWSLGIVLYTILAGCLPFDEDHLPSLIQKIKTADYKIPPWISEELASLLRRMIEPDPQERTTVEQLRQHPWVQQARAESGVEVPPEALALAASRHGDLFAAHESSEPADPGADPLDQAAAARGRAPGPATRRARNAFELINDCLNISAIFEYRDDIVTRRTRFVTKRPPGEVLRSIEHAAVACGGRVQNKPGHRMRLTIPAGAQPITVKVELFDMLPGSSLVELSKVNGNTAKFHKFYKDLAGALSDLIWQEPRLTSPDGRPKVNGFQMLGGSMGLDLRPMLDAAEHGDPCAPVGSAPA